MRRAHRIALGGLVALALAGFSVPARAAYRRPAAPFTIGDPGVLYAEGHWTALATGSWDGPSEVATAPQAAGPWSPSAHHLLTRRPLWTSTSDHVVWSPAETQIGSHFVVFYAALINREEPTRCIGTGISDSPTGPFVPRDVPIVCVAGHGAPDPEPGVLSINSTIDPMPSWLTIDGRRQLYLTYKTQHQRADGAYYSTIRMVRLNIESNATAVLGRSHKLTIRPDDIEENPVIVQRGNVFTMFTSVGGYTLCSYHTEWRQSTHLWRWPHTSTRLAFPGNTDTCSTGDAQVVPGLLPDSWRIFYSGRYPAVPSSFHLYVGNLIWPNGRPAVSWLLTPRG